MTNNTFVTLDSGKRQNFSTGARRDTQEGKPRYELIPVSALKRVAALYARGAEKYGESNWQKGMPFSRVAASMLRHAFQFMEGDRTEDHLAAVAWNAFAMMAFEDLVGKGKLPPELNDLYQLTNPPTELATKQATDYTQNRATANLFGSNAESAAAPTEPVA